MTTKPDTAIENEVDELINELIAAQIETFGQPAPLTRTQLRKFHSRTEKFRMLCEELRRMNVNRFQQEQSKSVA